MRRLTVFVLAILLLTALPTFADEIHLKTGDLITGKFVSLTEGVVLWKTPGGDLKINWADVTTIDIDDPVYVVVKGAPRLLTGVSRSTTAGRVELMPGGPVALADIESITYRKSAWTATGGAGAGIVNTQGNTHLNTLRLAGDLTATHNANRFLADGIVTHSKDAGIETARNWSTSAKYERFINRILFAQANMVLTNDRFQDLDLRSALGVGVGLQLINNSRVKLSGAGGIGTVKENFRSIPDLSYTAAYESASLTIALIPNHVQLFHTDDGYFQVTKGDQTFVRTQSGLRFTLGSGFVATLEQDWNFDRHPSPGFNTVDTVTSFTLGYRF